MPIKPVDVQLLHNFRALRSGDSLQQPKGSALKVDAKEAGRYP
jgi:hypothetical protein